MDDEMQEYSEAVIDSLTGEGIAGVKAGIGRETDEIYGLRNSYYEGISAISIGMRYHYRENVFLYSGQSLERILESIPDERKKEIRQEVFHRFPGYGLPDDLIETVRVFFQNDLNLTAASRQLFIHRNTLNYRLDKIKKETGLDLRSFQDAVIFRIVSDIPEDR